MAAGENLRRSKGSPRKNSFNNRGLITGAVGEVILPANLGAAKRGDPGQEGRIDVISHDGILDAVGAERPEAVGVDGGAVELVAGTVEVTHADLAGVLRTAAIVVHSEVRHISDVATIPEVATVLLETGLRYCRRCPHRLRRSTPPLSR